MFFHCFKEIRRKGSIILIAVTFFAVSAISAKVLYSRPPQYLYEKYGEYKSLLLDYSHCPCLYIDSTNYNMIEESALQFLVDQDDALVISYQQLGSEEIKKYIAGHKDNDKLLVYFLGMDKSEAVVIDAVTTEFGYKNGRVLVDSLQAPCYLFE